MLADLMPMLPKDGPPLPRGLKIKWPWWKESNPYSSSNPIDTTLEAEIEEMTQKKREEFKAKGYPPGLIEKALLWAKEWSWGLPGVKAAFDVSPEVGRQVYKGVYKQALALSNRWIEGLDEFLTT